MVHRPVEPAHVYRCCRWFSTLKCVVVGANKLLLGLIVGLCFGKRTASSNAAIFHWLLAQKA